MNTDRLPLMLRTAAMTFALAVGVMALPSAHAEVWSSSTGGVMCRGASGLASAVTYYANTYAQNTSSSGQYMSCGFTDVHAGNTSAPTDLWVGIGNPTGASISFSCAVQSGYAGGAGVLNTVVNTPNVAANNDSFIYLSGSGIPPKGSDWSPYTLSCLVPAQGKIGLLTLVGTGTV